jgi:hypothetical protein
MNNLKEFIIDKVKELHLNIYYNKKDYENTEECMFKKIKDMVRYEQLKEVIRMNPEWDNEEIGREISRRINQEITL